jgi:DNA ligase D-like protein (predicted ligase)
MKEKEWLLERVDKPQLDFIHHTIEPMLCESTTVVPSAGEYGFEVKWDGIRALIIVEEGKVRIVSRNQNDITAQFPELQLADKSFRTTCALFDGEIVSLDPSGKPMFKKVLNRLMTKGETSIQSLSKSDPCFCYIFDCLYLDGRSLVNESLNKRQEWLRDTIRKESPYRISESVEDGESLFMASKELGLEGIIAKRKNSKYTVGKRTDAWLKIKVRATADCFIVGYTEGKGNRNATFGALQIAQQVEGELIYRGKVGTGFDDNALKEISAILKKQKKTNKPTLKGGRVVNEKITQWIQAKLVFEISYAQITKDEMFREPVFVKVVGGVSFFADALLSQPL